MDLFKRLKEFESDRALRDFVMTTRLDASKVVDASALEERCRLNFAPLLEQDIYAPEKRAPENGIIIFLEQLKYGEDNTLHRDIKNLLLDLGTYNIPGEFEVFEKIMLFDQRPNRRRLDRHRRVSIHENIVSYAIIGERTSCAPQILFEHFYKSFRDRTQKPYFIVKSPRIKDSLWACFGRLMEVEAQTAIESKQKIVTKLLNANEDSGVIIIVLHGWEAEDINSFRNDMECFYEEALKSDRDTKTLPHMRIFCLQDDNSFVQDPWFELVCDDECTEEDIDEWLGWSIQLFPPHPQAVAPDQLISWVITLAKSPLDYNKALERICRYLGKPHPTFLIRRYAESMAYIPVELDY